MAKRNNNSSNKSGRRPTAGPKKTSNRSRKYRDDSAQCAEGKGKWGKTEAEKPSGINDISWYSKYPDLMLTSASLPFPNRPGIIRFLPPVTATSGSTQQTYTPWYSIPGVMALNWSPSIGTATQVTDPINVAAKEIYAKVRAAFSGNLDADAPDYIMYIMALDSYFSYIAALKRIYRVIDSYSPNNLNTPDVLLHALGLTAQGIQNLKEHKPQFLGCINQLVYQSRKFNMPTVMDIFNRHYWMNDNVYTDAPDIWSQFYVFRQDYFWKYSDNIPVVGQESAAKPVVASGLELKPAPWVNQGDPSTPQTVELFYNYGLQLISAVAESNDGYTISGYLQRAYESGSFFTVDLLTGAELLEPTYSEEVLSQIENSFAILSPSVSLATMNPFDLSGMTINQDPQANIVKYDPMVLDTQAYVKDLTSISSSVANGVFVNYTPFSMRMLNPTPADVVIASRLHAALRAAVDTEGNYRVLAGTEIPLQWKIWRKFQTNVTNVTNIASFNYYQVNNYAKPTSDALTGIALATQFDWNPFNFLLVAAGDYMEILPAGDVHNFNMVSTDQLEQINRVCVLSELNAYSV